MKSRVFRKPILIILVLMSVVLPARALAVPSLSQDDYDAIYGGWVNWKIDSAQSCSTANVSASGLDAILQAIAAHESSGNPTVVNPAGAAGKYQFLSKYWQSSAKAVYPPGLQYASAEQAPESAQDAVEYLRFIPVYNKVNGDPFATAIYNYWPALYQQAHANHNDPQLNFAPDGKNGPTIKEFGDSIVNIINSGKAKNIPMKYAEAPDFQTWLTRAGGPPTGSTSTPTTTTFSSSCGASNGVVAGNITQTALNFSWPKDTPESRKLIPKPEYATALQQFNPSAPFNGADCGAFVATVMRASGADPNYPLVGTINQEKYVAAHPEKYNIQFGVTSTADLQPGDILIINEGAYLDSNGTLIVPQTGNAGSGHTMLYVGSQPPNGFSQASASFKKRMANLGPLALSDGRGTYMRARLK